MFLFGKKRCVGLDIGSDSIKISESSDGKKISGLKKYPLNPMGDLLSPEGERKKIKEILNRIMRDNNFNDKKILCSVQAESVMVKYLELPGLTDDELNVALPIETERIIPFHVEDIILNYKKVFTLSEDPTRMGLTVTSIPKQIIEERTNLFASVSFNNLDRISIPSSVAFEKTGPLSHYYRKDELAVYVDIGSRYTNVALGRNDEIFHSRFFSHGGRDFTEALMKSKRISFDEAEKIRRDYVIGKDKDVYFIASLESWAGEVKRTLEYYRIALASIPLKIGKILLSGGAAGIHGMTDYISRISGVDTYLDRLVISGLPKIQNEMKIKPEEMLAYKVAVGLSLD